MLTSGNPSALRTKFGLPDGFVREILNFVVDVWKVFEPPSDLEVPITNLFRETLAEEYAWRGYPWFISLEEPVVNLKTGQAPRRTNIRFFHRTVPGQNDFFVLETKRLNLIGKKSIISNADEYIKDGMIRFVTGGYSKGLSSAAMVGYVMNGHIASARRSVNKKIYVERNLLCCEGEAAVTACDHVISSELGGQTQHLRAVEHGGALTLYHLFLAVKQDKS